MIHRREKSQRPSERDISDLSGKDEGNDAHGTDPPCLRERCLVTVIQIVAYVNMIWHTMMYHYNQVKLYFSNKSLSDYVKSFFT